VTTPVAADGLYIDGEGPPVVLAESPREMADGIVNLLKRPDERARLAEAGRKYVEKHFVWERSIAKLERMWLEAAAQGKALQAAQ